MEKKSHHKTAGKPLQFDKNNVLQKAMEVFWEYGYENTSIDLLEKNVWISRSSITNTFQNKRGLYNASLEVYQEFVFEKLVAPLRDEKSSAREALRAFFQNLFSLNSWEYCGKGCLILNTAWEFWGKDDMIKNLVEQNIFALENEFETVLHRSKKDHSLTHIPQNASKILVSSFVSLHTISKTLGDEKILKTYVDTIFSVIESWK
jgi:TetR/AcrR family transcriptional repressor of nem operon